VSSALKANDQTKLADSREILSTHIAKEYIAQPRSKTPSFFALVTPYFFGIVRRQDSVPGCWRRK
jgi:hypothetical protein